MQSVLYINRFSIPFIGQIFICSQFLKCVFWCWCISNIINNSNDIKHTGVIVTEPVFSSFNHGRRFNSTGATQVFHIDHCSNWFNNVHVNHYSQVYTEKMMMCWGKLNSNRTGELLCEKKQEMKDDIFLRSCLDLRVLTLGLRSCKGQLRGSTYWMFWELTDDWVDSDSLRGWSTPAAGRDKQWNTASAAAIYAVWIYN